MNLDKYQVKVNKELKLSAIDTTAGVKSFNRKKLKEKLLKDTEGIAALQYKLSAESRQSLLIILQGMDSSGKDGTVRHIMSGVNPQGVIVHSFKHPTELELEHDYLWRHAQKLPEHGQITIFNRSHYENVLISKVHPGLVLAERMPGIDSTDKIDKGFWHMRYKQINDFEKTIVQNGTQILKFFLHLSANEQRNRFLERINNREKHWKFSSDDIAERKFWREYENAYEQALKNTSTKTAPWFIIPADDKAYAHFLAGRIVLEKLREMNPSFPRTDARENALLKKAKKLLKKDGIH